MKAFGAVETRAARDKKLAVCNSCEHYRSAIKQCKVCLCVMPVKTWVRGNTCPLGKHEDSDPSRVQ